jgi:SAM-dependent methyltransferase
MNLAQTLAQLEAAADPSRLRLLAVLADGEAAVGELCAVLDQSQPRVSRHLRLLSEAGLIENFREGRWVFYRLAQGTGAGGIGRCLEALRADGDAVVAADRARMGELRRRREAAALREAGVVLLRGGAAGSEERGHLAEALAEVLDLGPDRPSLGEVLDIGCGSGTVLGILAPRVRSAVGIDPSPAMRQLARSRLHAAGLDRCTLRDADMHALPFETGRFDLVVVDEVLGLTREPGQVLREAARVLRPGGQLLVLDRVLPAVRRLPEAAGGALYENQLAVLLGAAGLHVARRQWLPGRTPDRAVFLATVEPPRARARTGTYGDL